MSGGSIEPGVTLKPKGEKNPGRFIVKFYDYGDWRRANLRTFKFTVPEGIKTVILRTSSKIPEMINIIIRRAPFLGLFFFC